MLLTVVALFNQDMKRTTILSALVPVLSVPLWVLLKEYAKDPQMFGLPDPDRLVLDALLLLPLAWGTSLAFSGRLIPAGISSRIGCLVTGILSVASIVLLIVTPFLQSMFGHQQHPVPGLGLFGPLEFTVFCAATIAISLRLQEKRLDLGLLRPLGNGLVVCSLLLVTTRGLIDYFAWPLDMHRVWMPLGIVSATAALTLVLRRFRVLWTGVLMVWGFLMSWGHFGFTSAFDSDTDALNLMSGSLWSMGASFGTPFCLVLWPLLKRGVEKTRTRTETMGIL